MSRRTVVTIVALVLAGAPIVVLGLINRGQRIVLDFGFVRWQGEAVVALYAALFAGLALMFLLGLPADLAGARERRRLARRVDELESERGNVEAATREDEPATTS